MHQHKHGFTIIEVSLVLAIAGLILVMAFIALPALQRQSRDAKRKEDTMLFIQALKKYQQNNRGQLPPNSSDIGSSPYIDSYSIVIDYDVHFVADYKWPDNPSEDSNPWVKFYNRYLGDNFTTPDGEKYTFLIQKFSEGITYNYDYINEDEFDDRIADLYIFISATCENGKPVSSNNGRNLAIVTKLEAGTYCADM